MNKKMLGTILIVIGIIILVTVFYRNSLKHRQSIVFSPKLMLSALWDIYKKENIDPSSGRTLDRQRNDITTSEGESYTMLRAVWQDDKPTFDSSWQFTKNNLKRPNDNLFSWLYGKRSNGSYGILDQQGASNTAADADTDIATALLFAGSRWGDSNYILQAKNIITDIWNNEVVTVGNTPYMAADNLEKDNPSEILVNPSYLAPYAYRLFAQVDPGHNWNAVVDSSYQVLEQSSASSLDKKSSSGLPPDWVAIDKRTGQIKAPSGSQLTTNYGFDALRTPFRMALDWEWNKEPRAKAVLSNFGFLGEQWQNNKTIYATYTHDGQVASPIEVPAMYGGSIGYFMVVDSGQADSLYKNKLQSLYSPDYQDWKQRMSYYDDNWTWFGLALYNKDLNDLFNPDQTTGYHTFDYIVPARIKVTEPTD